MQRNDVSAVVLIGIGCNADVFQVLAAYDINGFFVVFFRDFQRRRTTDKVEYALGIVNVGDFNGDRGVARRVVSYYGFGKTF